MEPLVAGDAFSRDEGVVVPTPSGELESVTSEDVWLNHWNAAKFYLITHSLCQIDDVDFIVAHVRAP